MLPAGAPEATNHVCLVALPRGLVGPVSAPRGAGVAPPLRRRRSREAPLLRRPQCTGDYNAVGVPGPPPPPARLTASAAPGDSLAAVALAAAPPIVGSQVPPGPWGPWCLGSIAEAIDERDARSVLSPGPCTPGHHRLLAVTA